MCTSKPYCIKYQLKCQTCEKDRVTIKWIRRVEEEDRKKTHKNENGKVEQRKGITITPTTRKMRFEHMKYVIDARHLLLFAHFWDAFAFYVDIIFFSFCFASFTFRERFSLNHLVVTAQHPMYKSLTQSYIHQHKLYMKYFDVFKQVNAFSGSFCVQFNFVVFLVIFVTFIQNDIKWTNNKRSIGSWGEGEVNRIRWKHFSLVGISRWLNWMNMSMWCVEFVFILFFSFYF